MPEPSPRPTLRLPDGWWTGDGSSDQLRCNVRGALHDAGRRSVGGHPERWILDRTALRRLFRTGLAIRNEARVAGDRIEASRLAVRDVPAWIDDVRVLTATFGGDVRRHVA